MIRRYAIASFVLVAMFATPEPVPAEQTTPAFRASTATVSSNAAYRQVIRQTPILQRPDRPGHFYGNTVRRRHRRANGG